MVFLGYLIFKNSKNENTNISKQIQILINQFKVQNYDYIISKGNTLLKKNPEYLILYNYRISLSK